MTVLTGAVLVLDDDPAVREALESLLRSVGLKVSLFASVTEFEAAEPPDGPCCLVLDIRMPGQSGLDLQASLNQAKVRLPIIFITGHGDIPMSVRAMKAGAIEFLAKPFRDQDLLDAIYDALERDRTRRAEDQAMAALESRFADLTRREREIMAQVATGKPNKRIAEEDGVTEITVKVHRGNVMRKMEAASLAELVRMADRLGLTVGRI